MGRWNSASGRFWEGHGFSRAEYLVSRGGFSRCEVRLNHSSPGSLPVLTVAFFMFLFSRVRRSIGPPARGNHEYVDGLRGATELWVQHHGRLRQICTPNGTVHERSVKHQMCHPVVATVIREVLVLRHHVRHGSRLQRRQSLLYEFLDAVDDLSFRLTGQYHVRSFIGHRQNGAGSRRIEADRTSKFRVPEISRQFTLEWAHPSSLHDAYESILALDGSFIAMRSKNQDFCIV